MPKVAKNKWPLVVYALLALGIAYLTASLAIDRGNWWFYLETFIFISLSLHFFIQVVKNHGKK